MSAEVLLLNAGGDEVSRITSAGYAVRPVKGKRFAARAVPVKSLPFRMWDRIKTKLCGV